MKRIAPIWIAALPLAGLLAACAPVQQAGPAPAIPGSLAKTAPADQRARIEFDSCIKPEYPRDDLAANHTGTVMLGFLVSSEGVVQESHILRSSGYQGLDRTALTVLSKCRFQPARQGGRPVQAWAQVSYVWSIDKGPHA